MAIKPISIKCKGILYRNVWPQYTLLKERLYWVSVVYGDI